MVCVCVTVDLHVYESRGDDFIPTVNFIVCVTLLIKEQLLWVQDLPITHPQVLPAHAHTHTHTKS